MHLQRRLAFLPLLLAAGCAAPAASKTPAEHHATAQGHAPGQHACAPVAPDGPQRTIARASVNGRPEIRYYVIGDAWPFCQKVVAAVSELREVQGEAVDFVIVPAAETAKRQAEIELYNLTARKHGLVAFDAGGEPVLTLAGHTFGKPEIEMAVAQVAKP